MKASTARDDVQATMVMIDEIIVGEITRNNVLAIIFDGDNPKGIRLGMSFF